MGELTRDGTVGPVSRDQILRPERGEKKGKFGSADQERRVGKQLTRLMSNLLQALAGLVAGWTSVAENEMQDLSSESSHTARSHELQIPGTLGGRTWAKWALPLSPFAGLAGQSASLWVGVLWYEDRIFPPLLCCCCPPGFG